MQIDETKLKREYGSIQEFCRQENITVNVYYSLKNKKTESFQVQKGKDTFKAFKKLEKLGFIKENS